MRYTIKLTSTEKGRIEATFDLPSDYPETQPDVSLRGGGVLSNKKLESLASGARSFARENAQAGEPSVLAIVQWLNDNIDDYLGDEAAQPDGDELKPGDGRLVRYWIYSHHIYNKTKRRTILEVARGLNLTGFSCPGKPGVICAEGQEGDVDGFWQEIRSLRWKKIALKHREVLSDDPKGGRSFDGFEEKCFQSVGCRDAHMDAGALLRFLQEKNLQHIFNVYFGLSGMLTSENDSE